MAEENMEQAAEEALDAQAEENGITEEDLDRIADTAIATIQDILKHFDVGEVTIDEYEGDEGELILDITGDDLAVLIGRHGKTLDALQFLVSAITVRTMGFRYPVIVDVEGYKNRQREKLESIARNAAAQAAKQHRSVKLRHMTPWKPLPRAKALPVMWLCFRCKTFLLFRAVPQGAAFLFFREFNAESFSMTGLVGKVCFT